MAGQVLVKPAQINKAIPKGHFKTSTTMWQLHVLWQCSNKPIAQPAVLWGGDNGSQLVFEVISYQISSKIRTL